MPLGPLVIPDRPAQMLGTLGNVGANFLGLTIPNPVNSKPRHQLQPGVDNVIAVPTDLGVVSLVIIQPDPANTTVDWTLNGAPCGRASAQEWRPSLENQPQQFVINVTAPIIFEFEFQ